MYKLERFEKKIDVEKYIEGYVNVNEFLQYCKECPSYGASWTCPPHDFESEEYWRRFKEFHLVGYKIIFEEGVSKEERLEILLDVKKMMGEELFREEAKHPGSVSLSAGSCHLCEAEGCTRKKGEPCRYPDKKRYSVEALGGNVGKTVTDMLGIELQWIEEGKLPEYFVLVGGLLI